MNVNKRYSNVWSVRWHVQCDHFLPIYESGWHNKKKMRIIKISFSELWELQRRIFSHESYVDIFFLNHERYNEEFFLIMRATTTIFLVMRATQTFFSESWKVQRRIFLIRRATIMNFFSHESYTNEFFWNNNFNK